MSKEDSSCGETGPQDTPGPDVPSDVSKNPNADVYDNRGSKKIIRVVTVIAYLFSVSFVGILLSAYYIFLWEPPNPRLIEHLRADPQVQFLIAAPEMSSQEEKETADSSLESKPNRTSNSFLGRMIQDTYDGIPELTQGQPDEISEKQRRLNVMLLKLRQSLVEVLRAQHQNSSHEMTNPSGSDSFVKVQRVSNLTKKTDYAISGHDDGNIARDKTDDMDSPSEFTDSVNTLNVENTSSAAESVTIPGTETNQNRFDGESVTDADRYSTPIAIDCRTVRTNSKRKLDIQRSSKLHNSRQESTKQDDTDSRQSITPVSKNEKNSSPNVPNDVHSTTSTIALRLEGYVENQIDGRLSSVAVNSIELNLNNNENPSNDRIKHVARARVSIESPSADSDLTEDPEFDHQPPDYLVTAKSSLHTGNTEETQIERMTVRSTTLDNKHLKETSLSTTERQRSLWEILTEIADIEETSVKLASISTTRNYRNNLTSTANDDDESVT